jgi:hypothetical protein
MPELSQDLRHWLKGTYRQLKGAYYRGKQKRRKVRAP